MHERPTSFSHRAGELAMSPVHICMHVMPPCMSIKHCPRSSCCSQVVQRNFNALRRTVQ